MKTELQILTDEQLLEEIKRQWYEKGAWDRELQQKYKTMDRLSLHDEYFSSDVEQHIDALEREYKSRGFELPDRWAYVAQFMPDEDGDS